VVGSFQLGIFPSKVMEIAQHSILIFTVSVVAGVINTLAGGGSLITLPVLIFLRLPATVANGTNRL